MAAAIKNELGVEPEIVEGARGEFTVWVGERVVARKSGGGFPSDDEIVRAVREATDAPASPST